MGQSTDALLVYGYDLGNEDEWHVPELVVDYDEEGDDEEEGDEDEGLAERVIAKLLVAAGFVEPDPEPGARRGTEAYDRHFQWYLRRGAAEDALPVKIETHCSVEYPMYLLAAYVLTARRGYPEFPDFAALESQRVAEDWDGKLAAAATTLGWTLDGPPRWILCSDWG